MIPEKALRLAGDHAVLVARPSGVAHVYTGPLTRGGGGVPRRHRPVCRARTRRLRVVQLRPSLDPEGPGRRLCARCSACLSPCRRQAEHPQPLRTRDEYRATYADATALELVTAARLAETPDELDQVAHLSLALFGHGGCTQPIPRPDGRTSAPLHVHIGWHRQRVNGFPDREKSHRWTEHATELRRRRSAEIQAMHEQREERIKRLGFVAGTR